MTRLTWESSWDTFLLVKQVNWVVNWVPNCLRGWWRDWLESPLEVWYLTWHSLRCQYLYFWTSKASKLNTSRDAASSCSACWRTCFCKSALFFFCRNNIQINNSIIIFIYQKCTAPQVSVFVLLYLSSTKVHIHNGLELLGLLSWKDQLLQILHLGRRHEALSY